MRALILTHRRQRKTKNSQVDEEKRERKNKRTETDSIMSYHYIHHAAPVMNYIMQITLLRSLDDFKDSVALGAQTDD